MEDKNIKEAEERTSDFWNDIDGIITLLNNTDPKHTETTIESPQVNHYLMWRILTELKEVKIKQRKINDIINKKEEMYKRIPNIYR